MIQLFASAFEHGFADNIGLGIIKSYLAREGYNATITYIESDYYKNQDLDKIDFDCKIFGFSMYPDNIMSFVNIINRIKTLKLKAIIVIGSKFVTAYYDEFFNDTLFNNIDYAVLGDGEKVLLDLIKCIEKKENLLEFANGNIHIASRNNLLNKKPAVSNISELPFPERRKVDNYYFYTFIHDAQGCTANCSFCAHSHYHKKWEGRHWSDIYKEILNTYKNTGIRSFLFTSGSFEDPGFAGKEKIRNLCKQIILDGHKFSFQCFLRADTFKDNEYDHQLLDLMYRAGFVCVNVGVESGNKEDLRLYNKKATVEDNIATLNLLKSHYIESSQFGFIMFNPYSTKEKLRENYRFLVRFNTYDIAAFFSRLYVYKSTALYEKVKSDGLLIETTPFYKLEGYDYLFQDPEIQQLWNYIDINSSLKEVMDLDYSIGRNMHYILHMKNFTNENKVIQEQMHEITINNTEVLKKYLYDLFEQFDIISFERHFNEFLRLLIDNEVKMKKLKTKLMVKLMRADFFGSK